MAAISATATDTTVAVILSETTALSETQGFKATFSSFHDSVSVSEWGFSPPLVNFRVRWRFIEPGRQEISDSSDTAGGWSLEENALSTFFVRWDGYLRKFPMIIITKQKC